MEAGNCGQVPAESPGRKVNGMEANGIKGFVFEHVELKNTGADFPIIFKVEKGYRRMVCYRTSEENEYVVIIGVADTKVDEPEMRTERKEDEEVVPLLGFVFNGSKEAEMIGQFFSGLAEQIEKDGDG